MLSLTSKSGGGIAGLTVGAFLAKSLDIELHVFEGKSNIRAIGAGIAIWKRYWDILEEATNLESECAARGLQISPWSEGEYCSFHASGCQTQPYS